MTIREFFLIFARQSGDVIKCSEKAYEGNNQSWRRIYARTVFSIIEWTIIQMKDFALEKHKVNSSRCCKAAISYLEKETDYMNIKSIKKTYKTFACICKAKYYATTSSDEWYSLKISLECRKRIVNPQHEEDLIISDKDLDNIIYSFTCHQGNITDFTISCKTEKLI